MQLEDSGLVQEPTAPAHFALRSDARIMRIVFVWPYWNGGASYDELRWSMRSVWTNFISPADTSIEYLIVGDPPTVKKSNVSWYSGPILRQSRSTQQHCFEANLQDALQKWHSAVTLPDIPETIVWMMDDVYLIQPVTLSELSQPRCAGTYHTDTAQKKLKTGFQICKHRTMLALDERGLTTHDFSTHLPHVVEKSKVIELFNEFDPINNRLLWETLYHNRFPSQSLIAARPFLRFFSNKKTVSRLKAAAVQAKVFVNQARAWNEAMRTFLFDRFPSPAPFELDSPAPPKRLAAPVIVTPPPAESLAMPSAPVVHRSRPLVTAVLNCFGRPESFPCQVNAIRRQSVNSELLVWRNEHAESKPNWDQDWFNSAKMTIGACNRNLGVWARFAFALNAQTEFVCVFDDDIIPGPEWFQNCLETLKRHNGLLGGHGVVFDSQTDYTARTHYGWRAPNRFAVGVDIVGNAWFCRREWLGLYWSEMPDLDQSSTAGEDFHFSYMLQKHGIGTYVPRHRKHLRRQWSCFDTKKGRALGNSGPAICRNPEQAAIVQAGLQKYVSKGFRLQKFCWDNKVVSGR